MASQISDSKVRFFFDGVPRSIRLPTELKRFILSIFRKEKRKVRQINYIFCSDSALLTMNRCYLNHDYYTDILTFDLSENTNEVVAEVYISLDRVRDNAKTLGKTIAEELNRVVFHGALHLCGYDDSSPSQRQTMTKKENLYLDAFKRFT